MKHKKRILLLFSILLVIIALFLVIFFNRNPKNNPPVEAEVRGSETLNCDETFFKVQQSLDSFTLKRDWYLIGEERNDYNLIPVVIKNQGVEESMLDSVHFKYLLKDTDIGGILRYDDTQKSWIGGLVVDDIKPDNYNFAINVEVDNCELILSKSEEVIISHPVYVTWTMDWEGFDVEQKYLDSIETISEKYNMPVTHFFNPYIYLNIPKNRAEYLTQWILARKQEGDSIGLHLHMNNPMIRAAGVTPKTDISWGGWAKNGQDIPNTVYEGEDYEKILQWALNQFEKNSIPYPTMYRAGGWYIDEENLKILEEFGFKIDASGRTYYIYGDNKLEGPWDLQTTTQPYRLNSLDQNILNNPNMDMLEFPNNGADSWAYSSDQLISRFTDNYKGGISYSQKVITYLSHPHWFNVDEPKMYDILDYTSKYSIEDDRGPVIYTTIDRIEIN
jgi:predicted deacetylase